MSSTLGTKGLAIVNKVLWSFLGSLSSSLLSSLSLSLPSSSSEEALVVAFRGVSGGLFRVGVDENVRVGVSVDIGVAAAEVGIEGVEEAEGAIGNSSGV